MSKVAALAPFLWLLPQPQPRTRRSAGVCEQLECRAMLSAAALVAFVPADGVEAADDPESMEGDSSEKTDLLSDAELSCTTGAGEFSGETSSNSDGFMAIRRELPPLSGGNYVESELYVSDVSVDLIETALNDADDGTATDDLSGQIVICYFGGTGDENMDGAGDTKPDWEVDDSEEGVGDDAGGSEGIILTFGGAEVVDDAIPTDDVAPTGVFVIQGADDSGKDGSTDPDASAEVPMKPPIAWFPLNPNGTEDEAGSGGPLVGELDGAMDNQNIESQTAERDIEGDSAEAVSDVFVVRYSLGASAIGEIAADSSSAGTLASPSADGSSTTQFAGAYWLLQQRSGPAISNVLKDKDGTLGQESAAA